MKEFIVKCGDVSDMAGGYIMVDCDTEEIVRCKDCVKRGNEDRCIIAFIAKKQEMPHTIYDESGEWFCKDGENHY